MRRFAALLLAAVLLVAGGAARADEPVSATPDPASLEADWWTYFEPAEEIDSEALQARVADARVVLEAYLKTAGERDGSRLEALIARVGDAFSAFRELKSASPPEVRPLAASQDSYTLDQALQRHATWRTLKGEVAATREELDWQQAVIEEERSQQSRLRSRYLGLDDTDPERLEQGLQLMLNRAGLEMRRIELERRRAVLRRAEQQLQQLRAELDEMPARLTATTADVEQWQQTLAGAREELEALRAQARELRGGAESGSSLAGQLDEAQVMLLGAVQRDLAMAVQELGVTQARLALALLDMLVPATGDSGEAAAQLLVERSELAERLAEQRNRWERLRDRVRTAVIADQGERGDGDGDAAIADLLEATDRSLGRLDRRLAATAFTAELLEARRYAGEGWLQRQLYASWEALTGSWGTVVESLGSTLFEISETPVTALGLLRVVLVLTLAWWLSKGIQRGIRRVGERRGAMSQSSLYTFGRLIHYTILAVGVIIGLSSIGIDFTKFALFASALGVGIGFGLQTLISNFVAGLIILFEKSLKVGDFVELESGVTGEVKEINMRSTLITTNDNVDILVPNSEFVGGRVINWTLREVYKRIHVSFGVAYGTDKDLVKKAVLEAAAAVRWTLKDVQTRQPQVWFVEFGDSSLNFELVVWLTPEAVKRPAAVNADYLWEIETKLGEYGIVVPFPQRDLHLRSYFGLMDGQAQAAVARGATTP